jgi:predicted nucleic acid-binding protein
MKNVVVVDTNIVIKWVLREPDSSKARALLTQWINKGTAIIAPALLAYEVANVLHQNVRKGQISLEEAKKALKEVLLSELELDFLQDSALGIRAIELANNFNLPATYDTHYLALAEREGCELWTADTKMGRAVKGKLAWVRWLEDYHTSED